MLFRDDLSNVQRRIKRKNEQIVSVQRFKSGYSRLFQGNISKFTWTDRIKPRTEVK